MDPITVSAASTPSRRILCVDDEENVCRALARSLRRENYDITVLTDATVALELMRSKPFDIVISDHRMPTMTGLEFLKRVHDRHPDSMRMMLTGQAEMQTAIDAINQGEIYRFLTKPWDDMELKVTLTLAFEQLDLERENRRLLAMLRTQKTVLSKLESEYPGITRVMRDSDSGAVLIS